MPSSKGKPTDPKLRDQVKEEVKNETNTDGGGKGQWSAWKAAKLSKEYEKRGGSYENAAGSKNEPKKGTPEPKSTPKKKDEEKKEDTKTQGKDKDKDAKAEEKEKEKPKPGRPKANTGVKKDGAGATKKDTAKKEKPRAEGARRSKRVAEKEQGGENKKAKK